MASGNFLLKSVRVGFSKATYRYSGLSIIPSNRLVKTKNVRDSNAYIIWGRFRAPRELFLPGRECHEPRQYAETRRTEELRGSTPEKGGIYGVLVQSFRSVLFKVSSELLADQ
jgi:hypothetical protein